MPRPGVGAVQNGRSANSNNPIANWLANRKQMKQNLEEEAAKKITESMANNENSLIDTLNEIDFLHSEIPKEILNHKSNENQPCGDLEYSRNVLIKLIRSNPVDGNVDLRKIDANLLKLAGFFKVAVEHGEPDTAYAAKTAIYIGLKEIRQKVPQNNPEILEQFVNANAKYLDSWITLVGMTQTVDQEKKNMDRVSKNFENQKAKNESQKDNFAEMIKNDPKLMKAFLDLQEDTGSQDSRASWTDEQRSVHKEMVEQRFTECQTNLIGLQYDKGQQEIAAKESKINIEHAKLTKIPIVSDPNLMNKFIEDVNELFDELARTDVEIDETLQFMDEIDGRIIALQNAPGSQRAREVAQEQAEKFLEEIRAKQEAAIGNLEEENKLRMQELGIMSEEELEQQKQAYQQQIFEEETDAEILYN